jgi:hypothetical protein
MITDDELAELPEDPMLAFVQFEKILRERVDEQELQAFKLAEEGVPVPYSVSSYKLEYISKVLAAATVYKIHALQNWTVPSARGDVDELYTAFTADVDHFTTQVRIQNAPRNRQNSVGLDGNTKATIHHYIQRIREAIEKADLPEDKKDSLYSKLNNFALEVDKNRTALQAGMAVYIAVCDGIGQGFRKLEPVRKMIDSIAALLGRAKEAEDSLRLPSPPELRRIPPPLRQLEPPPPSEDDEIPF